MSDYISEKIEQYERKLKQAEKAGKHNKAKKYQEKLERLRAEAAEQSTESDTDSDDDGIDSDDEADNSFALDEEPDVAPQVADRLIQAVFAPFKNFFSLVKRPLKREIDDGAKAEFVPYKEVKRELDDEVQQGLLVKHLASYGHRPASVKQDLRRAEEQLSKQVRKK